MIADLEKYRAVRRELIKLEYQLGSVGKSGQRHPRNINALIVTWESFGPGYGTDDRILLEDYVHFLRVRDVIEQFLEVATPVTRSYLDSLCSLADERFRMATTDVDPRIPEQFTSNSSGWWWMRTPKTPGAELRRAMNLPDVPTS
jgi:hypothetical protein